MEPHRLADLLRPEGVLVPLNAIGRETAIAALIDTLALDGSAKPGDRAELKAAVLAREQAGSTGMGKGIAIPHARSPRISNPKLAVGLAAKPIDFRSADGQLVDLVFLLAVPEMAPKSHLKILAALSRIGSDSKLMKRVRRAASATDLFDLLADLPV